MTAIVSRARPALRRRWPVGLAIAAALVSAACGKKGLPRPPEPRGPLPPAGVAARQIGSRVEVNFDVPRPRGGHPAQQPARAELVRVEYPPGAQAPADPDAFRRRGRVVAAMEGDPLPSGTRVGLEDPTWRDLAGEGQGWTLRYGVRVLDQRGRPSSLVVGPDLVSVEVPPPPGGLEAEATADGIRLRWHGPEGEGPFRFNVYRAAPDEPFGEAPLHEQPLAATEYLDTAVTTGQTYRYAVRLSAGGAPPYRESAFGEEVLIVAEDRFPPEQPRRLVGVLEGGAVRLFWDPNQEKDLSGYRVYRSADPASWERVGPDPVSQPLFLDREVTAGQRLAYRVTAVDRASPPNESLPSEVVEVLVAEEPAPAAEEQP